MQLRSRPWLLLLAVAALPSAARADGSSGTWTGDVEVRGNYYWERSTRVIAPELNVELESPHGVRLEAGYLLDTITSASIAAGAITDNRFTERRHDFRALAGYELGLGAQHLDLSVHGRYSTEPDYTSTGAGVAAALSLNDRSTKLSLGVIWVHDEVGMVLRGAERVGGGRDLSDRGTVGSLDAFVANLGLEQALSPRLLLTAGYDLGLLYGYQHNPYRQVGTTSTPRPETHPDRRQRHNAHARLAWYVPESGTALHALYRVYLDSWDIGALGPEARIYQELGDLVMLRLRYRYYTQTAAYFVRPDGEYDPDAVHVTDDPKMTAFHSHLLGTMLLVRLEFLERSVLDFAWRSTLELTFEYLFSTSSYGDAILAQAAVHVPF